VRPLSVMLIKQALRSRASTCPLRRRHRHRETTSPTLLTFSEDREEGLKAFREKNVRPSIADSETETIYAVKFGA